MVGKESLLPDDWYARGEADLSAAEILLKNRGDVQVAAALVQQGLEKHLKGWLLSKGWTLVRIHDLQRLLDDAVVFKPGLTKYYGLCEKLTAFYFIDRYPFVVKPPRISMVKDSLSSARELVNDLKKN